MTENAVLAAELSRIVQDGRYSAEALGHWLNRHHAAVEDALRSRPEPAADAVEALAIQLHAEFDDDAQEEDWEAVGESIRGHYREKAKAALAALPRPEADEGAVTALRAVMGLDSVQTLFEAAEEYPHGPEDVAAELSALKLARAAMARGGSNG